MPSMKIYAWIISCFLGNINLLIQQLKNYMALAPLQFQLSLIYYYISCGFLASNFHLFLPNKSMLELPLFKACLWSGWAMHDFSSALGNGILIKIELEVALESLRSYRQKGLFSLNEKQDKRSPKFEGIQKLNLVQFLMVALYFCRRLQIWTLPAFVVVEI